MAGNTSVAGASVLHRAMELLDAFDESGHALPLTELAMRAGLPVSTTHRLLMELCELGMLTRNPAGRYSIGTRLWEIGERSPVSVHLHRYAVPHLLTLYEATGENVHLAVLDGFDVLYLARISGQHAVPTVSRMGSRHPLHTTGVGKALLAAQDDEFLEAFLRQPLERHTAFSITSVKKLRDDILHTRARGYSRTQQEMTLGNVSLGVVIPPMPGLPTAAVGVVAHTTNAVTGRLVPLLKKTAIEICTAVTASVNSDPHSPLQKG